MANKMVFCVNWTHSVKTLAIVPALNTRRPCQQRFFTDSKVYEAHMGPTRVLSVPGGPHVGLMNLAIRVFALCARQVDRASNNPHLIKYTATVPIAGSYLKWGKSAGYDTFLKMGGENLAKKIMLPFKKVCRLLYISFEYENGWNLPSI